jgi:hypothetical protein
MTSPLWNAVSLLACAALLAACQPSSLTPQPTENTLFNVYAGRQSSVSMPADNRIQATLGTIPVSLARPEGWTVIRDDNLTLLQHDPSLVTGVSSPDSGVIITVFAPELDVMRVPAAPADTDNHALWVLRHVVEMPSVIGHSAVASAPVAFDWNGYPAAYYLLTGQGDKRAIVMGVALGDDILTGINIALPDTHLDEAHSLIGQVFEDFTVGGVLLGSEALDVLPDPLVFPASSARGPTRIWLGG